MAFFNKWPYSNLHNLNLDYILEKLGLLNKAIETADESVVKSAENAAYAANSATAANASAASAESMAAAATSQAANAAEQKVAAQQAAAQSAQSATESADAAQAAIAGRFPVSIANGGTGGTTRTGALKALSAPVEAQTPPESFAMIYNYLHNVAVASGATAEVFRNLLKNSNANIIAGYYDNSSGKLTDYTTSPNNNIMMFKATGFAGIAWDRSNTKFRVYLNNAWRDVALASDLSSITPASIGAANAAHTHNASDITGLNQHVIKSGKVDSLSTSTNTHVTFDTPFESTPVVVATAHGAIGGMCVLNVTETGFDIKVNTSGMSVDWIARE